MFRSLISLLIVSVLALGAAPRTLAQDASPASEPLGRNISLLQELGLPEINLIASDSEVTGVPSVLAAGRYLVTLENQTVDQSVGAYILAVPPGTTDEDALHGMLDSGQPNWFYDAIWAGGPIAGAGQTDAVVLDLAAGTWWIAIDRGTAEEVQPTDTATKLEVTGELADAADIPGAISVTLTEYSFAMPATLAAGPQIWQVANIGAQPHFLDLQGLPEGTTLDQVMELLSFAFTGTPAASELALEDTHDLYATSNLSSGRTMWIEVDIAPGTYGLACFLPDQATQVPHAMLGMVQVFTAG